MLGATVDIAGDRSTRPHAGARRHPWQDGAPETAPRTMAPTRLRLTLLRDKVVAIGTGTAFVVVGLVARAVAAVRRRTGVRVFAWLGVWSALYGLQELTGLKPVVAVLPRPLESPRPTSGWRSRTSSSWPRPWPGWS